jgi:hypothetical protein
VEVETAAAATAAAPETALLAGTPLPTAAHALADIVECRRTRDAVNDERSAVLRLTLLLLLRRPDAREHRRAGRALGRLR